MISDALTQHTDPLYQRDGQLSAHKTSISSIQLLSYLPPEIQCLFKPLLERESYILTTVSTIFHPQGGGQPSDTGIIILADQADMQFRVQQVRKIGPTILHMGIFDPIEKIFERYSEVEQRIDVEKRVIHSRIHTGGHVVGLAVNQLIASGSLPLNLVDGKASHYPGASFVEFTGLIPAEAKAAIQAKVDELIVQDLDVKIHIWSEEKARSSCTRTNDLLRSDEKGVRVVEIGGAGSYPCGGTHVLRLSAQSATIN
ncbi:metal-dependent hydrolase related to alanyl-tRNA synthetase HxxxH domain protein [Pyrenophora tritici-repentis]|uniref:Metal-dependent hydrolase related to alanyl-tRNA synthetase HxxxH domain protein n=1 Tax=Pyrenophora tritici-repentis TaxID=45151 RepID=A0A316ZXG3_9PLEO|nr:metal-dependent hydrolase related to alanyl-tRNA synthetase HxxxH domain protein [Pyrenophora tritici-repentis]